MKTRFFFLYCILLCLSACNDGVFVDKLAPSVNRASIPSNGSMLQIDLGTDDWEITSVASKGVYIYGDVYNLDGNLLKRDAPLCGDGLFRMVSRHPTVDFVIESVHGDGLQLTVNENTGGNTFPLSIVVSNPYDTYTIDLSVEPSEPYRLDSIVYDLEHYTLREGVRESDMNEVIQGGNLMWEPCECEVYPFQKACYLVDFTCGKLDTYDIFGTQKPEVCIPIWNGAGPLKIDDRKLVLKEGRTGWGVPDSMKTKMEVVTVPPRKCYHIEGIPLYRSVEVGYTLYAVHPRTGRKQVIKGKCKRMDPYDYMVDMFTLGDVVVTR